MKIKQVNPHRSADQAAAPKPDTGASVSNPTEWVRLPALEATRGIKKGSAYNLIHNGKIQSVVVPCAGKTGRGLRLVNLRSVDSFLNRLLSEQRGEPDLSQEVTA